MPSLFSLKNVNSVVSWETEICVLSQDEKNILNPPTLLYRPKNCLYTPEIIFTKCMAVFISCSSLDKCRVYIFVVGCCEVIVVKDSVSRDFRLHFVLYHLPTYWLRKQVLYEYLVLISKEFGIWFLLVKDIAELDSAVLQAGHRGVRLCRSVGQTSQCKTLQYCRQDIAELDSVDLQARHRSVRLCSTVGRTLWS